VIGEGEYYGMQTFDQSLLKEVTAGTVDEAVAMEYASSPHDFKLMLASSGRAASDLSQLTAEKPQSAPAAGEIRWNGQRVDPFSMHLRAVVAYAGHLPALKDELTTEENLVSLVGLSGALPARAEIGRALDSVALSHRRSLPARLLSAGQRRRIGLARLLLARRPLWILDEPVTALDAAGAALLARMVHDHLDRGGIAVAATHQTLGLEPSRVQSLALGETVPA